MLFHILEWNPGAIQIQFDTYLSHLINLYVCYEFWKYSLNEY